MGDIDGAQVEQPPEHLVGVYFEFEPGYLRFVPVLLDGLVEVAGEVVHDYVEVLLLALVGIKAVPNPEVVGVAQYLQDLQLPVLVLLVLEDPLDGHHLQGLLVPRLVDHPESAAAHFVLKGVAVGTQCLLGLLMLFIFAQEGYRRLVLLLVEDLVDGGPVGVRQNVPIPGLGVQFG